MADPIKTQVSAMELCFRLQHSPLYHRDWFAATLRWESVMYSRGVECVVGLDGEVYQTLETE